MICFSAYKQSFSALRTFSIPTASRDRNEQKLKTVETGKREESNVRYVRALGHSKIMRIGGCCGCCGIFLVDPRMKCTSWDRKVASSLRTKSNFLEHNHHNYGEPFLRHLPFCRLVPVNSSPTLATENVGDARSRQSTVRASCSNIYDLEMLWLLFAGLMTMYTVDPRIDWFRFLHRNTISGLINNYEIHI